MNNKTIGLIFFSLVLISTKAASGGMVTDRPDFTESAANVPRLHLQSELGVDYTTIGDANELTMPNWLLRFGLLRHLELRLGLPSYVASFEGDSPTHDVSGLELGTKMTFGVGEIFRFGFLPYMVIPIREAHIQDGDFEVGGRFVWSVELGSVFSLGGNLGLFGQGFVAAFDPTPGYLASLSLGIGLTRRLGIFAEFYTISDFGQHWRPIADGGLTYLVTPRFQLDAYFGVGLSARTRGVNPGAGLSFIF